MGYSAIATAQADGSTVNRVSLGLQRRAAVRISAVANNEDQRERAVCQLLFQSVPTPWVTLILLQLDTNGVDFTTVTDAQIDTAVTTAWGRLIGLVA